MMNQVQVVQYRNLPNPPQSLWNALYKNIELLPTGARSLKVDGGGYSAIAIFYHFLKQLNYSDKDVIREANVSEAVLLKSQKMLYHALKRTPEYQGFNNKIQLVENFMIHEQLGYFYYDKTIKR